MLQALKRRNPGRKPKKLALQMGVSTTTMRRALKRDLGLKLLKKGTCHMLSVPQKIARVKKAKALLKRYAPEKVKRILFTDEKIFTVEVSINKQNDRVYGRNVQAVSQQFRKI